MTVLLKRSLTLKLYVNWEGSLGGASFNFLQTGWFRFLWKETFTTIGTHGDPYMRPGESMEFKGKLLRSWEMLDWVSSYPEPRTVRIGQPGALQGN